MVFCACPLEAAFTCHICAKEGSSPRSSGFPVSSSHLWTMSGVEWRLMEKSWDARKLYVHLELPVLNWWTSCTWPLGICSLSSCFLVPTSDSVSFSSCALSMVKELLCPSCSWKGLSFFEEFSAFVCLEIFSLCWIQDKLWFCRLSDLFSLLG